MKYWVHYQIKTDKTRQGIKSCVNDEAVSKFIKDKKREAVDAGGFFEVVDIERFLDDDKHWREINKEVVAKWQP